MELLILQKGSIFFLCRPKVQHEEVHSLDDVQHFFIVLKPEDVEHFIFIIIGRKKLPEVQSYFGFVEKIAKNMDQVRDFIAKEHYTTLTKGERDVQASLCIGRGKYLLINHEQHTHLVYALSKPLKLSPVQKEFHLKKHGDFLITVKSPTQPSPPGVGLSSRQKAQYPNRLQSLLGDYRFIPLNPTEFLDYEGTELLFIGKSSPSLEEKNREIAHHLGNIKEENIFEKF